MSIYSIKIKIKQLQERDYIELLDFCDFVLKKVSFDAKSAFVFRHRVFWNLGLNSRHVSLMIFVVVRIDFVLMK